MFYIASKTLWFFATPTNALIILAFAGALFRGRLARIAALVGAIGLVIVAFSPLGIWLREPLENAYPILKPDPALNPAGIIVLGGSFDEAVALARDHQVQLNDAAERATEAVALARRYPQAKLIFTGGTAALVRDLPAESDYARRFFLDIGVPAERLLFEDKSRNTEENARFTRELLQPKPGERFILITSAYHMRRSVALFTKAGFDVIPAPVDFYTQRTTYDRLRISYQASHSLLQFDRTVREWIGLFAYWMFGKI